VGGPWEGAVGRVAVGGAGTVCAAVGNVFALLDPAVLKSSQAKSRHVTSSQVKSRHVFELVESALLELIHGHPALARGCKEGSRMVDALDGVDEQARTCGHVAVARGGEKGGQPHGMVGGRAATRGGEEGVQESRGGDEGRAGGTGW
jgi:hypothetical protein